MIDLSEDYGDQDEDVEGVNCYANSGSKRIIEALQSCPWNDFTGIVGIQIPGVSGIQMVKRVQRLNSLVFE